ncbi:MAG: phosphogluconate dehydrogenase (NAD(+)-dependent, decarboxylating) [Nitrospiria bacterium]
MQIGFIGLGKMGANMTRRLLKAGHPVVVTDRDREAVKRSVADGAAGTASVNELVSQLSPPRAVWLMVPSGTPTESAMTSLMPLLSPGDTVIDGGNSYYRDSMRRGGMLKEMRVHFLDVGTSGGIWGLTEGYSLMIGGEAGIVQQLSPIFESLAPGPKKGWGHVGPNGAGHFVKMIHNGIEYGLMQAYAEGFGIMNAKQEFGLNLPAIAEIWRHGSVVRSWLLDLTAGALSRDPDLSQIKGWVADSGEGRWTVVEAIDLNVSAPVITLALQRRLRSREAEPFADKLLAAMRHAFGGHDIKERE